MESSDMAGGEWIKRVITIAGSAKLTWRLAGEQLRREEVEREMAAARSKKGKYGRVCDATNRKEARKSG